MRHEFDPWVRKIPGSGNGNPHQYSSLKNSMDRGAWWATVQVSQRVRHDWARTHTYTHTCPCQGCGEKYYLLHQNQSRGKLFSFLLFFLNFLPLSMFFQIIPPTPILPFFQSHSLLDFISLKKKTFIYLSKCAQDRSRSIIIMKYKITQACFSFLGLLQASRKFPGQKGQQGEKKQPQSPSPHTLSIQGFPAYKPSASLYSDKVVWIYFKQAANWCFVAWCRWCQSC